jgi:hypothetical protein
MSGMFKADILNRLERADEDAYLTLGNTGDFRVVIVGGSALIYYDYIPRATEDIDVLNADSQILPILEAYDINSRAAAYETNFPYHYEDRLTVLFSGRKITFYTASLEDIVISKLCSNRPGDWSDVAAVSGRINWVVLEKLARDEDELYSSILSPRSYADFLASYEEYERRFRQ